MKYIMLLAMTISLLGTACLAAVDSRPQLSRELQDKALAIAKADPGVQKLLAGGAKVDRITPVLVSGQMTNGEQFSELWAEVHLRNGDKTWVARVNLRQERVEQPVQ